MLSKLWESLKGSKTYLLSLLGAVVALVGHLSGGTSVLGVTIPDYTTAEFVKQLYASGVIAALRAAFP